MTDPSGTPHPRPVPEVGAVPDHERSVDSRLRQYAQQWRDRRPDEPDVEWGWPAGRTGAPKRTGVLVLAAAVAVVMIAVGAIWSAGRPTRTPAVAGPPTVAASSTPPRPTQPVLVPSNNSHIRPFSQLLPEGTKVGAPNGTRDCADSDFVLQHGDTQEDPERSGWLNTRFLLRSTTRTACALPNSADGPNMQLVGPDDEALPNDRWFPAGPVMFPDKLLVRPGLLVAGDAQWAVQQDRTQRPAALVLNFGADDPHSPLRVSVTGVAIAAHPAPDDERDQYRTVVTGRILSITDPGSLASLSAFLKAPATVKTGATLPSWVTVSNDTNTPVKLSPCPEVVEQLRVVGQTKGVKPVKTDIVIGVRGPLNCGQAPKSLAPGSSITFEMALDTAGQQAGEGMLSWQLLASGKPALTLTWLVTVTH